MEMELGEKIRLARLEAGLSQRQLCGQEITRNMLSQIEHGTAKPSMKTLAFLASRLKKSVSYFLDEDVPQLPGQQLMEGIALLDGAEEAIVQGKFPYARQLLDRAEAAVQESSGTMERRRLLLLGRLPGEDRNQICAALPSLDEELLLRAEAAQQEGNRERSVRLLAAVEDREAPRWNLLQGTLLLQEKQYTQAAVCLRKAEGQYPREAIPMLETCFRELGDFQQAYLYACKQKAATT